MNIETALKLSEYAHADKTLLPNHMPFVPAKLKTERDDILFCIEQYKKVDGEADTVAGLEGELKRVEHALTAYA